MPCENELLFEVEVAHPHLPPLGLGGLQVFLIRTFVINLVRMRFAVADVLVVDHVQVVVGAVKGVALVVSVAVACDDVDVLLRRVRRKLVKAVWLNIIVLF